VPGTSEKLGSEFDKADRVGFWSEFGKRLLNAVGVVPRTSRSCGFVER
jgi:hypothetical protein